MVNRTTRLAGMAQALLAGNLRLSSPSASTHAWPHLPLPRSRLERSRLASLPWSLRPCLLLVFLLLLPVPAQAAASGSTQDAVAAAENTAVPLAAEFSTASAITATAIAAPAISTAVSTASAITATAIAAPAISTAAIATDLGDPRTRTTAAPLPGRPGNDARRLVGALMGDTPLIDNLRALTDEVGGRPTGSAANLAAVDWAVARFREAGVHVSRERFIMPARWLERSATAEIRGKRLVFPVRIAAMPFSVATPPGGLEAPLVDAGFGTDEDFARLGTRTRGAMLLVETEELRDVEGLFREYAEQSLIEGRAQTAGVAGIVYVGSRPRNLLHRHNASRGEDNDRVLVVVERDGGLRALRLLRSGHELTVHITLDLDTGGAYESFNVIGEIPGRENPDEFVLIGAHLDSWGLGTGALDNGCNVALVIDIARQMQRLELRPRRTIRFALFNGEEQGMYGSWAYTQAHAAELDGHVMASSYDIGSGRINGMFTNGRAELIAAVEQALLPVAGLGPFTHLSEPIVGTDNFDFMLQGVANLVANQEAANYGPNYHARSDTFDKVDRRQLRLNAAIAAAVTWGFAEADVDWQRHDRAAIEALIESTSLGEQMHMFPTLWSAWESGERGRQP